VGFSDRLYRLLLLALPRSVRQAYGDEMRASFREQRKRAHGLAAFRLWYRAAADAIATGITERLTGEADLFEQHVNSQRGSVMRAFLSDSRYALRVFARQPGPTLLAVVTLAVAISANTAIFSAIDALVVRPLPYRDPGSLVLVTEKRPAEGVLDNVVSPADFFDWARLNSAFESIGAITPTSADLIGRGEPVRLGSGAVSPLFFQTLGVQPALGRLFLADDGKPGAPRVAILAHQLWTTRFGSDPQIVGRAISLSGVPFEVVGVLPEDFESEDPEIQLWSPSPFAAPGEAPSRVSHFLEVFARLKPGVTLDQARADMDRVGRQLEAAYPDANRGHGAWVTPLDDHFKDPLRGSLLLLMAAVGFVMLIACVNVANILLARAAGRRREMAVRAAVGAGRGRLARQMITEAILLGIAGGGSGVVLAWWLIGALRQLAPTDVPLVGLSRLGLDWRVLVFTAVLSLGTALLFGLVPALHLRAQDLSGSLKEGGGRSAGGVRQRVRVALVVGEIALASLLLVAAGLTIRSLQAVLHEPAGFRTDGALTANIALSARKYSTVSAELATFDDLERRFRALPGVRIVGATSMLPLSGRDGRRGVQIEGRAPTPDTPTRAHPRAVTPGYFQAMGITLVAGRPFTSADRDGAPLVAIVNETMARRYWPSASPVGKRIRRSDSDWIEVVGVIHDVRHWGLAAPVNPEMYFPLSQYPSDYVTFVIATDSDAASLAGAVREQIREVDAELPTSEMQPLADVVAASVAARRSAMMLLAGFAGVALLLAVAGIYGVMSHLIALRTSEIGVRIALGATRSSLMALVLKEGAAQAAAGLTIGLTAGAITMRVFQASLYGVTAFDPLTLTSVAVVLLSAALVACAVPARRAMRVDPLTTLRV
jgi:putative ABC transport system permease protein